MSKPPSSPRRRRPARPVLRAKRTSRAEHFPNADGKRPPPSNSTNASDRIRLEFLAAYFQINRNYAALIDARSSKTLNLAERRKRERAALQEIEKALRCRDELEDRYAPGGVIAEPVMVNGFAVDVMFTFGNVDASGRQRSKQVESSAFLSIALPPRVRIEDLTSPSENGKKTSSK